MQCPRKCVTTSVHQSGGVLWYCPTSLVDLYALMSKHTDDKIRLVAGNTGKGINNLQQVSQFWYSWRNKSRQFSSLEKNENNFTEIKHNVPYT